VYLRTLDGGESEATMALFRGAIGIIKNPSSHRQVEFEDPTTASEVILMADLLCGMLDGARSGIVERMPASQVRGGRQLQPKGALLSVYGIPAGGQP
jgi:Protein of unknown function (Hypoth_ymh)